MGDAGDVGLIPGSEDPLEEEMATHYSVLAFKIPLTEEPCGLQSIGSQRSWTQLSMRALSVILRVHLYWHLSKTLPYSLGLSLLHQLVMLWVRSTPVLCLVVTFVFLILVIKHC